MAKKGRGLSDTMNLALIRGERNVRDTSRQKEMSKRQAIQSIRDLSSYAVDLAKKKEARDAKIEAYSDNLDDVLNVNAIEEDYNKQAVTDFLRDGRSKFNEAAKMYEKTKDAKYKDEMNSISFSFTNLNNQLGAYAADKRNYLTTHREGGLINLKDDDKYADMYTNSSQFSVAKNGDVGFTTNGEHSKFKDIGGKWGKKEYAFETSVLTSSDASIKLGLQGGKWQGDSIKNSYKSQLNKLATKNLASVFFTDITADDQFVIGKDEETGEDIMSGDQSLAAMWLDGKMDEKFYKKFKPSDGVDWIYDRENKDVVADLISQYYTDVNKFEYDKNFTPKREDAERGKSGSRRETIPVNYGVGYITTESADLFASDIKNKESEIIGPDGKNYKWNKDKNTYEQLSKDSDGKIIKTPISNKKMLMQAGVWQQGQRYRISNYEMVELEEDVQSALQQGMKQDTTAEDAQKMAAPTRKI